MPGTVFPANFLPDEKGIFLEVVQCHRIGQEGVRFMPNADDAIFNRGAVGAGSATKNNPENSESGVRLPVDDGQPRK